MGYGKDHNALLKPGLDFPKLNNPNSNGHISIIQTRNRVNSAALERYFLPYLEVPLTHPELEVMAV